MNFCYRVEDDFRLQGDITDGESTTRRGSTAARRSFLKRMKFQRSSSRDSKELASFSNTHLSSYLDSSMLSELDPMPVTYQRVERLECKKVLTELVRFVTKLLFIFL